jgi:hypothetical protein
MADRQRQEIAKSLMAGFQAHHAPIHFYIAGSPK